MSDLESLEKEFCPPIDSALFFAIVSDFDLTDPQNVQLARQTLEPLKASALDEEGTAFDPSGTSTQQDHQSSSNDRVSAAESWPHGSETETTSLSADLRSLSLDGETDDDGTLLEFYAAEMAKLDVPTKKALLLEMFPSASEYTVEHILRKCDGKWDRAMDELLNQALLTGTEAVDGEDAVLSKGVDAFSYGTDRGRRGRKKKEKKNRHLDLDETRSSSEPAPSANKWDSGKREIEFITSRANIPSTLVSSLYYQHGASLPATIFALADSQVPPDTKITSDDPQLQIDAHELGREFPSIPAPILARLIHLTHPSTAAAHELAKAISRSSTRGGLRVVTDYARPPSLSEDSTTPDPWANTTTTPSHHKPSPLNTPNPSALASYYSHLHRRALSQARSAHGAKGHMSAAAAYYSQQSRDYARLSSRASSAAADAFISAQNATARRDEVDLHGVSVRDGVRIASARVAAWWSAGGGARVKGLDGRVVSEGGGPVGEFRVVTGLGRHSEGGKGKLTPAVERALVGEGWDAFAVEGVVTVRGKRRR